MLERLSRIEDTKMKLRHLKYKAKQEVVYSHHYLLLIIPAIMIFFVVGSVSSLTKNWELQQTIVSKKAEVEYTKLEVENLELENQYLASDEYQELAARKMQNKKLAGETMVYLPPNSDAAKNKYSDDTSAVIASATTKTNFDLWLSFLFGI